MPFKASSRPSNSFVFAFKARYGGRRHPGASPFYKSKYKIYTYIHVVKVHDLPIPSAKATPICSNEDDSAEMLKLEPGLAHVFAHAFAHLQNMSQVMTQ